MWRNSRSRIGERDGGARRGAVGDPKTAPGALRNVLFTKPALPRNQRAGDAGRRGRKCRWCWRKPSRSDGRAPGSVARAMTETDAESSGSKQGPPQAATAPRMMPLQDSRLAVPGPEIDVSACEHGSRAAGPLKSHSTCRRQGAAV